MTFSTRTLTLLATAALAASLACGEGSQYTTDTDESELNEPLGSVQNVTSGQWGAATTCKAIPAPIAQIKDPVIDISLDGLTLHLYDRQGTFSKVYPIGPGHIENGKSLTPIGHFTSGPADTTAGATDNPAVVGGSPWSWWYRCKIWWQDQEDPDKKWQPVYAGLPLIRLKGAPTLGYAIHGPIDGYSMAAGGALRRAFVSHGCIRMQAADILEVYSLIHGHGNVPINIQRAPERDENGKAIDLAQKRLGSECDSNADCNFAGGVCHANAYGHNFCTVACSGSCADRATEIATACVPDGSTGKGMCVRQASTLNNFCRSAEGFEFASQTPRFGSSKPVDACVPGSIGFVGDSCLSSADCASGRTCERHGNGPGFCTQACSATKACPTANGIGSVCMAARCVRACDVQDACGVATATTCQKVGAVTGCAP
ncbi:MAG: L,D-transpeptidase [Deltaproteobacteria bacterium]|nr:L,D-transpeptidase [Deltaproteobacteria bacterium]